MAYLFNSLSKAIAILQFPKINIIIFVIINIKNFIIKNCYNGNIFVILFVCNVSLFLQNILVAMSSSGFNVTALFQVCAKMEIVVIMKFPIIYEQNTKCINMKYRRINTI